MELLSHPELELFIPVCAMELVARPLNYVVMVLSVMFNRILALLLMVALKLRLTGALIKAHIFGL